MRFGIAIPRLPFLRCYSWLSCFFPKSKRTLTLCLVAGLWLALMVSTVDAQSVTNNPIFQFGAFYNLDLDFSPGQPITMNGKVHCNGTIWMYPQASATFNDVVEATVIVTNKDNPNDQQNLSSYITPIHYNGGPPLSGVAPVFFSPLYAGINPNNPEAILNLPPAGAGAPNSNAYAPSNQIYLYNECDLIISNSIIGTNGALRDQHHDFLSGHKSVAGPAPTHQ